MLDTTRNFVFLSYSHEDKESVEDIVAWFHEKGYNIAYDQDFGSGDNWQDKAESYIQNANCKGCIFLLSKNSMISNPVKLELIFANEYSKPSFAFPLTIVHPAKSIHQYNWVFQKSARRLQKSLQKHFQGKLYSQAKTKS